MVAEADSSLQIRELSKHDVDSMLRVMYLSRAAINNRFDQGERCFAVVDGGEIGSYMWLRFGTVRMSELYLVVKLRPNQAWFINAVTVKRIRGRGYYPNLYRYIVKTLEAEGFDEFFGHVEERNIASIRGLEKAGYKRVVRVQMRKLFWKIRYYVTVFDKNTWQKLCDAIESFDPIQYEYVVKDSPTHEC
jgi:RimJ/RimL family protein N-acetyltransferase